MQKLKENLGNIILFLGEIIVGIILLIKPIGFTRVIIMGVGILLIVLGSLNVIKYFKTDPVDAAKEQSLSIGLISLVGGLFCTFNANWFIATFPVLTALYGVVILLTGIKKLQWTVDSIRLKRGKWYITGISAALSIVFALIIIANPFKTITILWQFTGVILIIQAIFDVVAIVFEVKEEEAEIKIIDTEETKEEKTE